MAARGMDSIVQHLRRTVLLQGGAGLTDGQLLDSFIANQDAAAFEALVRRHGRMVFGVCLRVLRHRHDAEDAFQATFLVLAHKAAHIIPREMVGNWLYGVAHTTAVRARAKAAKRLLRERQVAHMPETKDAGPGQWDDLQPLLDEELTRLPDKYRLAIVLCDLEGRSRREVARQLRIPEGTLSSRLTTARRLLAKRLSARGVALSGAAVAGLLTQNASSACVPAALVTATVKAVSLLAAGPAAATSLVSVSVIALKKGVLTAMFINKLKSATMLVLMVGAVGFGGGLAIHLRAEAQQVETINKVNGGKVAVGEPSPTAEVCDSEAPKVDPAKQVRDASAIVAYLNDNSGRVSSVRWDDLDMTFTAGLRSFSLRGTMVSQNCMVVRNATVVQTPCHFRLSAKMLGSPAVDIGSNDQEFWYWISKAEPPEQVYCSYKDLNEGRARGLPLSFQPDWVMESMGLGHYGPPVKYKLEPNGDTLRLVEKSPSTHGRPIRKVVVLKRCAVLTPKPQVLAYVLLDDATGKEVCSAQIIETQVDRQTGAILPRCIEFRWGIADQKYKLLMKIGGISVNPDIPPEVFARRLIPGVSSKNLATE